jgi:hypothetical protein
LQVNPLTERERRPAQQVTTKDGHGRKNFFFLSDRRAVALGVLACILQAVTRRVGKQTGHRLMRLWPVVRIDRLSNYVNQAIGALREYEDPGPEKLGFAMTWNVSPG